MGDGIRRLGINNRKLEDASMRKRFVPPVPHSLPSGRNWLDLDTSASVEVTSEDKDHPIESALLPAEKPGWRAASPGPQTIRLLFNSPQKLRLIWLDIEETETKRTQEFTLRWSSDAGQTFREIVRQQWNFSPPGATREIQEYPVKLDAISVLELNIVPDIRGGEARASLVSLRLA